MERIGGIEREHRGEAYVRVVEHVKYWHSVYMLTTNRDKTHDLQKATLDDTRLANTFRRMCEREHVRVSLL